MGKISAENITIWANSFVQFECFGAGILLCVVFHGRLPKLILWQRLMLLVGAWLCWFFACYGLHSNFQYVSDNPGSWPLIGGYALGAVGSVLVLIAFLGVNPKLLPGWAIYLGRISFGLYVFHAFAIYLVGHMIIGSVPSFTSPIYFFKAFLTLGLDILLAAISYRYFEKPFLKMKGRHAIIKSQLILGDS